MQHEFIERELHVEASPEVVYEVVSSPEHMAQWWSDHAEYEPVAGSTGELVWGERGSEEADVYAFTVVEAKPPTLFSFRWCNRRAMSPARATPCSSRSRWSRPPVARRSG